jgi:hypothetical protein
MSLGMGIGILAVFVIIYLAIIIFMIASLWKIYSKAGQPGWACIVPIYNILVLLKVAGKPWWWILLMCIPIVNFVILIMVYHGISVNFGKDAGFTIGLILLPIIFIPILGFGKAQYIGTGVPQN